MVFASIVCGTAFKYYDPEGVRLKVKCPLCGGVNSFEHLQMHFPTQQPATDSEEDLVEYLGALTKFIAPNSPSVPIPCNEVP